MAEEEKSNWRILLIQLIIVIVIIILLIILGSQIISLGKEVYTNYDQQECNIGILSIQLSNASSSLKEYYLNQIYNSCQVYFENNTNNG